MRRAGCLGLQNSRPSRCRPVHDYKIFTRSTRCRTEHVKGHPLNPVEAQPSHGTDDAAQVQLAIPARASAHLQRLMSRVAALSCSDSCGKIKRGLLFVHCTATAPWCRARTCYISLLRLVSWLTTHCSAKALADRQGLTVLRAHCSEILKLHGFWARGRTRDAIRCAYCRSAGLARSS